MYMNLFIVTGLAKIRVAWGSHLQLASEVKAVLLGLSIKLWGLR